jgi:hypothetical protein
LDVRGLVAALLGRRGRLPGVRGAAARLPMRSLRGEEVVRNRTRGNLRLVEPVAAPASEPPDTALGWIDRVIAEMRVQDVDFVHKSCAELLEECDRLLAKIRARDAARRPPLRVIR